MGSSLIPLNIELEQDDRTVCCNHKIVGGDISIYGHPDLQTNSAHRGQVGEKVEGDMWQVEGDMWHLTCDTWHLTSDIWNLTCDTWNKIVFKQELPEKWQKIQQKVLKSAQKCWKLSNKGGILFYRCYYLHTPKYLVSSICGIFLTNNYFSKKNPQKFVALKYNTNQKRHKEINKHRTKTNIK